MTSTDFALAQQRIAARRQVRAAEAKVRQEAQKRPHASTALDRLPFPLSRLGRYSFEGWDVIKGREGTRPAFRVGQVDAELLDEELLELLKGQVGEALKYFGVGRSKWQRGRTQSLISLIVTLERRVVLGNPPGTPYSALQAHNLGS